MFEPMRIMRDRLIEESRGENWETRFALFAGGVQAIAEIAGAPDIDGAAIMRDMHPSLWAKAVVEGFGFPPIVDRYQAAIYFLSADPAHKEASIAWQAANQDEVRLLLAEIPTLH
jgi:hypothetical protein